MARTLGAALLSGLLLSLCFPSPGWGWLAWTALVPLVLALRGAGRGRALAIGLAGGLAFAAGTFRWFLNVPGLAPAQVVPLALLAAAPTAAWALAAAGVHGAVRRILVLPSLWVLADWLKAHAGFLSLPWATLAWTQHADLPILQAASVAGEYGVTFAVMAVNVAAAEAAATRRWRPAAATLLAVAALHLWGASELALPGNARVLRAAVVQPSILPGEGRSAADADRVLDRLLELTLRAVEDGAALVVWPESAVRGRAAGRLVRGRIRECAVGLGVPLIVGAPEFATTAVPAAAPGTFLLEPAAFNAAHLLTPDGAAHPSYRKRILVPFGEYLPGGGRIPWPEQLVGNVPDVRPGAGPVLFGLPEGAAAAPIICWENLFPSHVRAAARLGPGLLVQLTNEAHWGSSAGGFQHNLATVLRAAEHRLPAVIASNTGPSAIVDSRGRVIAQRRELFETGVIAAGVALGTGPTLYTRFGDWFVALAVAIVAAPLAVASCAKGRAASRAGNPARRSAGNLRA